VKRVSAVQLLTAVVFIDAIGANIVVPLLPFYGLHFGASPTTVTLLNATFALMGLIFAPQIGRIADRWGRRRVVLCTLAGSALCYLGFAFSTSLLQLFLFRALGGVMAGQMAVAQAMVADLTDRSTRARGMGLLNAAIGAGYILGPLIGGVFGQRGGHADFVTPFLLAALVSGSALLVGASVLPPDHLRATQVGPQVAGSRRAALQIVRKSGLLPFFPVFFCLAYTMHLSLSISPLWMHARFGYGAREVGYVMAVSGLATVAVQALGVGPITKALGITGAFRAGVVVVAAALAAMPFAPGLIVIYVLSFVFAAALGVANSCGHAIVSLRSPPERMAQLMGLNQSVRGLGQVTSPVVSGILFGVYGPSAPYAFGAAVLAGGVGLALLLMLLARRGPLASLDAAEV